ncbi:unnamed protein product [Closterium sp. NIES-54]
MMEKFFSFMSFYEQHQQAAPAQSNNSDNNNGVTPMSLDGSSYVRENKQQPTFAPYEPQRGTISFMPHQQFLPGQEKTLDALQPPMFITLYFIVSRLPDSLRSVRDHFLSLDPTSLTVDLLEQHLLAAETSAVAVDVSVPEDVGAASTSAKRCNSKGKGGRGGGGVCGSGGGGSGSGGGGSGGGGGGSGGGGGGGTGGGSGGSGGGGGGSGGSGGSGGGGAGGGRSGPRRGVPGSVWCTLWPVAQGVDYFQTFSPTPKMTTLRVLLHVAAQRDYELHSLDFSTPFLQGSLHEEIWLRRPPGFTKTFPAGTQWSLRRPVYGPREAPREWHDTLRTTLAALGFAPATAGPSLFLRTDISLPPFYVLVYVDDLVFATADTEALTLVKSELQKRHTWTDLGELRSYLGLQITRDRARCTITLTQSHMVHQVLQRFGFEFSSQQPTPPSTSHSLLAPPSDESIEPSGPYPELVGCLVYVMTCTRPDLAYPLSLLARYVAPGRHRKVHLDATKRVLRYLCSTSGMGLVLGGRGPVVLAGHADASGVDDSATQRSSQGYTFSLALYVDNKAMIALCQEHRLEHRTKHIALRYFLARELQLRSQLRLAYVATRANTADDFTKAPPPGDHQRFTTVLGLDPTATTAPAATATAATAPAATAAPACCATMALLRVLAFDHEGRPVQFDTWLYDLQLYLLSDSKDSVSLFDLASGTATAPPATS